MSWVVVRRSKKKVVESSVPKGYALRTLRVPVEVDPKVPKILDAYLEAANFVSKVVFETKILSAARLHRLHYGIIRKKFCLPSQLTCSLFRQVAGTYSSAKSNGRWRLATFRRRSLPLCFNRDFGLISLRKKNPDKPGLVNPSKAPGIYLWKTPVTVLGDRLPVGKWRDSKLCFYGVRWWLNISYLVPIPVLRTGGLIASCDRGINRIAVASVKTPEGKTHVLTISGRALNHRLQFLREVTSKIQGVGSRSARRLLKRRRRYLAAVTRHALHVASRQLIEWAVANGVGTLVFEDLTGIRQSVSGERGRKCGRHFRAEANAWPHWMFLQFVAYKAAAVGIDVQFVDPRNTSRTCLSCRCVDKRNRSSTRFRCVACNYVADADFVGSRNIGLKFISGGLVPPETGPINVRRKHGAVDIVAGPKAARGLRCRSAAKNSVL